MDINIRYLKQEESLVLIDLLNQLAAFEGEQPLNSDVTNILVKDGWGTNRKFESILIEDKVTGNPVGICVIFFTYSTFLAKETLFLEDLFIVEEYRSKGIGKKVFDFLKLEAANRNCGRFEWNCWDNNHFAHEFYKKNGGVKMPKSVWRMG